MATSSAAVPIGSEAPDFLLQQAAGGPVGLRTYRGRPVVLAFLRGFA